MGCNALHLCDVNAAMHRTMRSSQAPSPLWRPLPRTTAFGLQTMLHNILKLVHVLSIVVWVGGMVFAHFFLRPATQSLEPPQRVRLMHDVLKRFLAAVSVAIALVLASGLWMIARMAAQAAQSDGKFAMPLDWTIMATLGLVMMAIFGHIRLALFRRLQRAVAASDWPAGGQALGSIRTWVGVNLALGILTIAATLLL